MNSTRAVADDDPLNHPIRLDNQLARTVGDGQVAPTARAGAEHAELKMHAAKDLAAWDRVKAIELSAFNAMLRKDGVKPVMRDARAEQAVGSEIEESMDADDGLDRR